MTLTFLVIQVLIVSSISFKKLNVVITAISGFVSSKTSLNLEMSLIDIPFASVRM